MGLILNKNDVKILIYQGQIPRTRCTKACPHQFWPPHPATPSSINFTISPRQSRQRHASSRQPSTWTPYCYKLKGDHQSLVIIHGRPHDADTMMTSPVKSATLAGVVMEQMYSQPASELDKWLIFNFPAFWFSILPSIWISSQFW